MYKHVLVAVDGSDTSNLALQESIKLAKEQQAALRLVHVVDETPTYMTMDTAFALRDFQKAMREAGEKVLATCAATARQAGVEVGTKFIVLQTQRFATQSLKGRRHGFNHLLLGSVAEGVIRLATSPVLVIRGS